jgi:hypothetical protein
MAAYAPAMAIKEHKLMEDEVKCFFILRKAKMLTKSCGLLCVTERKKIFFSM